MFFKKLKDFWASKKTGEGATSSSDAPHRIDVTKLRLFEQVDPVVRDMVRGRQQFIREHITFINYWINKRDYNSAAHGFIQLKWVDYLNPAIPEFEQNNSLMSVVDTLPQQPDDRKIYCSFRQVHSPVSKNENLFQLTDHGYKDMVTSPAMPNRAYSFGESWRMREPTADDEEYYNTARQIIFHYYTAGFDSVTDEISEDSQDGEE